MKTAILLSAIVFGGCLSAGTLSTLGITNQTVTPDRVGVLHVATGAEVVAVSPGSPAARAGIMRHDVIISFESEPVNNSEQLAKYTSGVMGGSLVKLGIIRDGYAITLPVRVALPAKPRPAIDPKPMSVTPSPNSVKAGVGPVPANQPTAGENCAKSAGTATLIAGGLVGLGCLADFFLTVGTLCAATAGAVISKLVVAAGVGCVVGAASGNATSGGVSGGTMSATVGQ